jgi:hypothetical protein
MNRAERKAFVRRRAEEDFEKFKKAKENIEWWAACALRRLVEVGERYPGGAAAKLVCSMLDDERFPCGIKRAEELTEDQRGDLMDVLRYRDLISPTIEPLLGREGWDRICALAQRVYDCKNPTEILFKEKI